MKKLMTLALCFMTAASIANITFSESQYLLLMQWMLLVMGFGIGSFHFFVTCMSHLMDRHLLGGSKGFGLWDSFLVLVGTYASASCLAFVVGLA